MPTMKEFQYYGKAFAVDGQITHPVSQVIDGHARCGLPDRNPGNYTGQHDGHAVPNILSYGACRTEINATHEDADGFFRTEIHATVDDLKVVGDFPLSVDRIAMGMVTVYRRHWYEGQNPPVMSVRVLPIDCSLGDLIVSGKPAAEFLPPPFSYSQAKREAYLRGDQPDPQIEADIHQAIAGSASRFVSIPNFGRIFFGEWTITGDGASQHAHRISMLRLALGSPVKANLTYSSGDGDGSPPPPP
jgi:hypothetical protein